MLDKAELLERLREETGVFRNPRIEAAFTAIDRADFLDDDYKVEAYEDYALPIGEGQTTPQPTTLAFMLELLDPLLGHTVLDVGSGSGFTTALLAHMIGAGGKVLGIERIPRLVAVGQENIAKYVLPQASIVSATSPLSEVYDRILSGASFEKVPEHFMALLKPDGILVLPIGDILCKIVKIRGQTSITEFPGFNLPPYITEDQ